MKAVTLIWPGGEHRFALRLGELRALQDRCDAGPEQIMARVGSGAWRVDDLLDTIRLGLVGGGAMSAAEAGPFVTRAFERTPLVNFRATAQAILVAALLGVEDDPVGESEGTETETSPADGGSPASTALAP